MPPTRDRVQEVEFGLRTGKRRIAFGRCGNWENLVAQVLDPGLFSFRCVDLMSFDLGEADAVLPLTLAEAGTLRRRFGDRHPKFLLPDPEVEALCADKQRFNQAMLASAHAAMIPPLYTDPQRRYPYVLKRRCDSAGNGVFVLRDAADATLHADKLQDAAYFAQEYVPGTVEYATHMFLTDGKLRYHSSNRYEMAEEHSVKGSRMRPARERIGVPLESDILGQLVELLRAIGLNGICCVDYKLAGGRIRLLEVNPRCSFSLFRDINAFLDAYFAALGVPAGGAPQAGVA